MTDIIIIGGGLFGQVIAAALRAQGQEVRVLDRREPLAGSGPAACLMKPSWFSGLGRSVYEPALAMLDRLYGVQDLPFDVHIGNAGRIAQQTVHWVGPRDILDKPTEARSVLAVAPGKVVCAADQGEQCENLVARNVIVAAGVWTEQLLSQFRQGWQRGMAMLFPDHHPARGIIKPWAPYRQLVGFDRGDGLWVGDGSAIKNANWTETREHEIEAREVKLAARLMDNATGWGFPQRLQGIRPYWKGPGPCLLEEVQPGLWVASGGAKNGTIAAGWCAHELARRLS